MVFFLEGKSCGHKPAVYPRLARLMIMRFRESELFFLTSKLIMVVMNESWLLLTGTSRGRPGTVGLSGRLLGIFAGGVFTLVLFYKKVI